ncbi:unnamed protein product [Prunus brigantina]
MPLWVQFFLFLFCLHFMNIDEKSGRFSVEAEINRSCDETWRSSQKSKPFFSYQPVAAKGSLMAHTRGKSVYKDDSFDTLISKACLIRSMYPTTIRVGLELFDDLCPVELRFDACSLKFKQKEWEAYCKLKREFLKWQKSFDLHQEFCSRIESKSS